MANKKKFFLQNHNTEQNKIVTNFGFNQLSYRVILRLSRVNSKSNPNRRRKQFPVWNVCSLELTEQKRLQETIKCQKRVQNQLWMMVR